MGIQDRDYGRETDQQRNVRRKIGTVEPASPTKRHLAFLVAWLAVMGVLYVAVETYLTPPKATVTATGDLRITRARDGHFYIDGSIDGTAVSFLVDTGATMVVVSEDIARNLGPGNGHPQAMRLARLDASAVALRQQQPSTLSSCEGAQCWDTSGAPSRGLLGVKVWPATP